jgi:hypothetical protein
MGLKTHQYTSEVVGAADSQSDLRCGLAGLVIREAAVPSQSPQSSILLQPFESIIHSIHKLHWTAFTTGLTVV